MSWDNPFYFVALWVLPVLAGLGWYSFRRRRRAAEKFIGPSMQLRLAPRLSGFRSFFRISAALLAVLFMVTALARPRFGVFFEDVQQRGADLYIVLDVSRSMNAQDVLPNRLEKSKADCLDLLSVLEGDRVGLIVFAGKPLVKVPLTVDQGFLKNALRDITTESAPRGGTLIGDAIRLALQSMPPRSDRDQAILLITDGEDHESMPLEAAADAQENKVRIFTMAIGDTRQGSRIPVGEGRNRTYIKDQDGKDVWSKADEKMLEQIAAVTQGAYIPAGTKTYNLGAVYEQQLSRLSRGQSDVQRKKKLREQYQWFLAFGALALFGYVSLADCVRRSEETFGREGGSTRFGSGSKRQKGDGGTGDTVRAATGNEEADLVTQRFSRPADGGNGGFSAIVWVLCFGAVFGTVWCDGLAAIAEDKMEESASQSYEEGKYGSAAVALQAVYDRKMKDNDPKTMPSEVLTYNLARAWDKAGQPEKAIPYYEQASGGKDARLAVRAKFDLACLYSQQAAKIAGNKPADLSAEKRTETLQKLGKAIQLWREVKKVQADYPEIDQRLEIASSWMLACEKVWRELDWQKEAQENELLDYVQKWEEVVLEGRRHIRNVQKQPDSMEGRQKIFAASRQSELVQKLDLLRKKVDMALASADVNPAGGNGTPGLAIQNVPAQAQNAQQAMLRQAALNWLDEAKQALDTAEGGFYQNRVDDAILAQGQAVQLVDNIYLTMVPLESLVKRAIQVQKAHIEQTEKAEKTLGTEEVEKTVKAEGTGRMEEAGKAKKTEETEEAGGTEKSERTAGTEKSKKVSGTRETKKKEEAKKAEKAKNELAADLDWPRWIQDLKSDKALLSRFCDAIQPKATVMQNQLPPEPQQKPTVPTTGSGLLDKARNLQDALDAIQNSGGNAASESGASKGAGDASGDVEQAAQLAAAHEMCKKAIELGPKISTLVLSAGDALTDRQFAKSLTDQREALRLLEEILKNNQDKQNQDKQNQDKQNQDKQNQDKQNQDKQNQDKQNQDKQNQDKQNQDKQNQDKQNQDKQNQDKQDQDKQDQDKQNQDKQDQDKQDQDKQDQDKQDQDKQDQDKQDQDKQDQDKQDQDKQDQDKQDQDKQDQADEQKSAEEQSDKDQEAQDRQDKSDSELSESQVRAMMRRVQARQDEKRKLEERLKTIINPPEKVEKDW